MIHIPCTSDPHTSLAVTRSLTRPGEVWIAHSEGDSLINQTRVLSDALRTALDEEAPAGSYTRNAPGPDDMDGGVTAAAIEKEVDRADALAQLEALGDDGTALRCAVMIAQAGAGVDTVAEFCEQVARGQDVNVAARAEKAEKERDEARKARTVYLPGPPRPLTPDAITEDMCRRAADEFDRTHSWEAALTAAVSDPAQRPDWLNAPAVRAWHKNDGRTEHDGTPGKPRIWSPDYGTTETWSTPSLRNVHWSELVDVEPLDVSAELAEGLDRVAEFMSTGGIHPSVKGKL